MICINVSRKFAAQEATEELLYRLDPGPWAWIFIGEPIDGLKTPPDAAFRFNNYIQSMPKVTSRFWDVTNPCSCHLLTDEEFVEYRLDPISESQADYLIKCFHIYRNHNLVISCFAGKSRSGALCQFLKKYYEYTWPEGFKAKADPNEKVYNELVGAWKRSVYL